MIFINTSADYSANNIGKIDIPITIDETAQTIMAAYSKTLTKDQQVAFNILISGLKDSGIYNKIEYMYLPCLAGNVSEAFYDAKNGTSQDVSDTSMYGQYSLNQYGLYSVYDSSKSYTQFAIPLTRKTQGLTIASIAHQNAASYAGFLFFLKNNSSGFGVSLRITKPKIDVAMIGNNRVSFNEEIPNVATHSIHSITAENSPWLPSSENFKFKLNGQNIELTYGISSNISLSKNNNFYLGGYSMYSSDFVTGGTTGSENTIDFVAICPNLESTYCDDDATTTMADRLDSLVGTFKNAFFA